MSFQDFVNQAYSRTEPPQGRRKRLGRVIRQFWDSALAFSPPEAYIIADELDITDDDPYDDILDNVIGGVVLRTDYSDETAWQAFCAVLAREEIKPEPTSDDEDDVLLKIINPDQPLTDISNLTALRLLNDVGIRVAPSRTDTQNPLIECRGLQEVYAGVNIWIYDQKSNQDQCVRVVSQEGEIATGDSWRAQASHIYELQFNMTYLDMKINFGGLDKWDYAERKRNLDEC